LLSTAVARADGVPSTPAPPLDTVTFRTVPALAGVQVSSAGRTVTTDALGQVTLPVRRTGPGYRDFDAPTVVPTRLPSGLEARFGGLFDSGRTIGLSLFTRTRLRYVNEEREAVAPGDIAVTWLKSTTGDRILVRGAVTPKLQASRVVWTPAGVRTRPIQYAVESVKIAGGEVVHRGRQRFYPLRRRPLRVALLLYSARFSARDALFGNPAASVVELEYPDGHVQRVPLRDGEATAVGLPRGDYRVRADAPGLSKSRPLSLSRNQVVDLRVISYLDLAVALGALLAIAIALVLAGRPLVRSRLRRAAAAPARLARLSARR
jgi:hypothetical protein